MRESSGKEPAAQAAGKQGKIGQADSAERLGLATCRLQSTCLVPCLAHQGHSRDEEAEADGHNVLSLLALTGCSRV